MEVVFLQVAVGYQPNHGKQNYCGSELRTRHTSNQYSPPRPADSSNGYSGGGNACPSLHCATTKSWVRLVGCIHARRLVLGLISGGFHDSVDIKD